MTTFNIAAESFKVESKDSGTTVVGLALPFNAVSRNGFMYSIESVQQSHQTLMHKPVLFNHNSEAVIGHVKSVGISAEGMVYEMDINPNARNPQTGVAYSEAVARGDIPFVSIQCMYDEERSHVTSEGITNAFISEFLELSLVTIPGFADTTASVVESFKKKKETNMDENPKPEPKTEAPDVESRIAKLEELVAKCVSYVDQKTTEEADEEKEKPAPVVDDEDKDKKVEEAIKNNKVVVAAETFSRVEKELTMSDVKEIFSKQIR